MTWSKFLSLGWSANTQLCMCKWTAPENMLHGNTRTFSTHADMLLCFATGKTTLRSFLVSQSGKSVDKKSHKPYECCHSSVLCYGRQTSFHVLSCHFTANFRASIRREVSDRIHKWRPTKPLRAAAFWDATPRSVVKIYCFEGINCLLHFLPPQGW